MTILWQDGTEEKDIPTTQLYRFDSDQSHEYIFFPGDWVSLKKKKDGCYGIIQQVIHAERAATVKWCTYPKGEEKPNFIRTEETSIYDLNKHKKFSFRSGTVVSRNPMEPYKMGYVVGNHPEGHVVVRWMDGSSENCYPRQIKVSSRHSECDYTAS